MSLSIFLFLSELGTYPQTLIPTLGKKEVRNIEEKIIFHKGVC
jgi:hypothetical protein